MDDALYAGKIPENKPIPKANAKPMIMLQKEIIISAPIAAPITFTNTTPSTMPITAAIKDKTKASIIK